MSILQLFGNILWIVFGGIQIGCAYFVAGLIMMLTIVGIPFGAKLFQIGIYACMPFGGKAVSNEPLNVPLALIFNILWIPFGIIISFIHILCGLFYCITIIGIPFGLQHFKLMGYAVAPFGRFMKYN